MQEGLVLARNIYIAISLIIAFASFIIASKAFHNKTTEGRYLGIMIGFGSVVNLSYVGSLLAEEYFSLSLANSIYFAMFDIMLMAFLLYIIEFTGTKKTSSRKALFCIICLYAFFDILMIMANPFNHVAKSHYDKIIELVDLRYVYLPSYGFHLSYIYLIALIAIYLLTIKIIKAPGIYKNKYASVMFILLALLLFNGIFMISNRNSFFDVSILFFTVMGFMLYWNNRYDFQKGVFGRARTSMMDYFNNIIVIFDYENKFAMCNKNAKVLITEENASQNYTLENFINDFGFDTFIHDIDKDVVFQWKNEHDKSKIFRCDYSVIRDAKQRITTRMFVISDDTIEIDVITGFNTRKSLEKFLEDDE